ncbi:MAG: protein kinase, partial [Dokdonella sp.]
LERAFELDAEQRDMFLDAECGDDQAMRDELRALIAADDAASDFLAPLAMPTPDRSGERVGPWRLLHELGRGGMGTVYLAERADALYDKRVALKLLRFDAGDLRERFANERHILATLEHPNIARLLDAGSDERGAPYVALEYVEGKPITQWCDSHAMTVRARVMLFLKVLDAVQAAHGHLVVHRDIKPANILVDTQGEPKLLDFGIAKLLDVGQRGLTLTGFAPLTPDYASPEQVRGDVIGTSSDLYSLGVLLYELVTGKRPYSIVSNAPSDIARVVETSQPRRPSSLVPRGRRIDRDLDHVILKAMAKQARDRYASCAQFADDLRRHLGGEPVLAVHAGWRYRARKFVLRHRVGVMLVTLVAAMLVGSALVALTQARQAREQARLARAERDKAERVNAFLQHMLASADPADLGRNVTVVEVLGRAEGQAERELAAEPSILAATELTLAKTHAALGDVDQAVHSGELALAAAQRSGQPRNVIDARLTLGAALVARGDFAAAGEFLDAARQQSVAEGTPLQRGDSANQLGLLEDARGDAAAAQRWLETALAELPDDSIDARAEAMNDLALIKGTRSDFAGALVLQRQAVDTLRRVYPKGNPLLAQALSNLAVSLDDNRQRDAAAATYEEALQMRVALLGENHPGVASTLASMTYHDVVRKDVASALEHGARAWAIAQKLPQDHPVVGYAANVYSQALLLAGKPHEAIP